jgi:hypothetical protein
MYETINIQMLTENQTLQGPETLHCGVGELGEQKK